MDADRSHSDRRTEFIWANKVMLICIFIAHPSLPQVWLSLLGQNHAVNGYVGLLKEYLSSLKNLSAKS